MREPPQPLDEGLRALLADRVRSPGVHTPSAWTPIKRITPGVRALAEALNRRAYDPRPERRDA